MPLRSSFANFALATCIRRSTLNTCPPLPDAMTQQSPRSLKHEYELYVENEIENYKESVSRSAILKIGDEAAAALRAGEQFAMDEILLWAEVDRIIRKRLRIPAYDTWRRKRIKLLEEYRRPEHWGIRP